MKNVISNGKVVTPLPLVNTNNSKVQAFCLHCWYIGSKSLYIVGPIEVRVAWTLIFICFHFQLRGQLQFMVYGKYVFLCACACAYANKWTYVVRASWTFLFALFLSFPVILTLKLHKTRYLICPVIHSELQFIEFGQNEMGDEKQKKSHKKEIIKLKSTCFFFRDRRPKKSGCCQSFKCE